MSILCKPGLVPGSVTVGVNSHFTMTAMRFRTASTPHFTTEKPRLIRVKGSH